MFNFTQNILKTVLLVFIFISCSEDPTEPTNGVDGLNGFNALVAVSDEPAGENCTNGGVKIAVGQDSNANGTLDESEITSINFICNGSDGSSNEAPMLVARTSPENPGENCPQGGTIVEVGTDLNTNNILDDNEIQTSFFVCNGEDGSDGSNGTDGSDGTNGLTSLIRVTASTSCDNGGITIEIGLDDDQNGSLGDDEVDATYDICDGANGSNGTDGSHGYNTLSNVVTEPSGSNCPNGGILIQLGLDTDSNGALDSDEIVSENYICNGTDGSDGSDGNDGVDGMSSITKVTTENPGSNCSNGGLMIEIGLDDVTVDGVLQSDEVDFTYFVCNGVDGNDGTNGSDGLNSLIRTTTEEPGVNCTSGGIQIEIGLDNNSNGILDAGEVIGSPVYTCNGADGTNGVDGTNGRDVFVISESDRSCTNGGVKLTFGYDNNNDGDLEDAGDEILTSHTVCNGNDGADGSNGKNSIIRITAEDPGLNCTNGGTLVQVGIDDNENNNLEDPAEVDASFYVCNGEDGTDGSDGSNGNNSLISVSSFSGSQGGCTNGGIIIRTGVDDNGNGSLDAGEIDATSYVCDGNDGTNGSDGNDGNSDNIYEFYFQEGFDGYTGVLDVSITDKNPTERGESLSVDRGSTDSHGLLMFPDIDQIIAEVAKTAEFEVVEAILYLRGSSVLQDGVTDDNWIGAKIILPDAPAFTEDGVTWTTSGNGDWSLPGVSSRGSDGDAYSYSDMYRLPSPFEFNGFIPLLLSKSEVAAWTDPVTGKDDNKGIVLLMANASVQYELDVFTSNYAKDVNYRPTLYVKVKTGVKARFSTETEEEYFKRWNAMSFEEKLAPLYRK
ncbi:DUF7151 family protein [Ekhidna sp.]|uniref:DUF7151 family protein n=1 Tax=Ekhidna sp. TaxID=2608089 RepID=UPI003BAA1C12